MPEKSTMPDTSVVLPSAKWLSECPFDAPSAFDSGVERTKMNAGNFRPFANAFCFAAKCYEYIFTGIAGLFFLGSPSAVFRTVWAVIVYSVNRLIAVWFAHVSFKICVVRPSFANINAPPAIMPIRRVVFVAASLLHSIPYFIASWVFSLVSICVQCRTMRYRRMECFFSCASTRYGAAFSKICRKNNRLVSAVAFTQPSYF